MEWLQKYEEFLIKNATQITSIESSLRSVTYILPGRFHDAELASQAAYAALNLLGLYHNSILHRAAQHHAEKHSEVPPEESSFNRYVHFWQKSDAYRLCSKWLSVVSYTQVLLEMGVAKRWGRRAQWRLVAVLEAIKVILRLFIFHATQHRMGLQPTHAERDVDPASLVPKPNRKPVWQGKRTGIGIPSLDTVKQTSDVTDYLLAKVLTPDKVRQPTQLVHILGSLGQLGEVLYIIRPLVYVLAILRYGRRSWTPWLLSLVVEVLGQAALRQEFDSGGSTGRMTPLEKKEMSRRSQLIWLVLLRGAAYTRITRPRLERMCNSLERKPLVSIAVNILRDYLPLWESVYFYTSAS